MKYTSGFTVFGVSLAAAVFCEALSWLLIYNTSTYKSLTSSISKTSKKVETLKASSSGGSLSSSAGGSAGSGEGGSNKSKSKKLDKIKNKMKDANQSLSTIKFQSAIVVGATLLLVFTLLSSFFDGRVVAKLPFEPYPFFQRLVLLACEQFHLNVIHAKPLEALKKMTHRNLPGTDATDCAMVFIYMLCSLSLRPNLQKLLGFTPPRNSVPTPTEAASQFFGIAPEK